MRTGPLPPTVNLEQHVNPGWIVSCSRLDSELRACSTSDKIVAAQRSIHIRYYGLGEPIATDI